MGAKDNSFQYMRELHCRHSGAAHIHTFYIYIYIYAFSRRFYPKRLTITFSLYIFISMCVPWESNPQPFALLTQCSSTEPHIHTHTLCVSANHAGEQNFRYVQPDCVNNRPVKQYIVRGPFATASQTTQNNKPKLTKRCTRVLLRRLHVLFPINEAVTSSLHSNYSFFAEIIIFH